MGRDAARLVFRQQIRGGSSARVFLEIDEGECLPVAVADSNVGRLFLNTPRVAGIDVQAYFKAQAVPQISVRP